MFGKRIRKARRYLVPNAMDDGRTYLVRNLVCGDAYHGCFELVDVNAPFTPADLALADRFGDMLNMILPRKTIPKSRKHPSARCATCSPDRPCDRAHSNADWLSWGGR